MAPRLARILLGKSVGLSYLSGALKHAGHDTRIEHICEWLDRHFDVDHIVGEVRNYDPGLIAVSTGDNHYPEMRQLASASIRCCCCSPRRGRRRR